MHITKPIYCAAFPSDERAEVVYGNSWWASYCVWIVPGTLEG